MNRALPVFLALLLGGCASGPPGSSYPGAGFVFFTKEPPSEARLVSREVQEFLEDVAAYLRLRVPPGSLLRIYHYPNRWGLWWHLTREAPSLRWKRGACYETEEAYVVTLRGNPGGKGFQNTLRHELTHYLVAAHFCDIPPWIDEGLSQVMASGPPFPHLAEDHLKTVQRKARRSDEQGCRELLLVSPGKKLNTSQYHVACALTYYLLTRSSEVGPSRLMRFLETTRHDTPPEETFSASWGTSMEEACEAMVDWSESGTSIQESGVTERGPKGVKSGHWTVTHGCCEALVEGRGKLSRMPSNGQTFQQAAVPHARLLLELFDRDPWLG